MSSRQYKIAANQEASPNTDYFMVLEGQKTNAVVGEHFSLLALEHIKFVFKVSLVLIELLTRSFHFYLVISMKIKIEVEINKFTLSTDFILISHKKKIFSLASSFVLFRPLSEWILTSFEYLMFLIAFHQSQSRWIDAIFY
jgi:hypothetical protein